MHKLSLKFPALSSYADQLAILSDYFDNQVPLSIENKNLQRRVAALEAAIAQVQITPQAKTGVRKGVDCTAWMGSDRCMCPACKVGEHA